MKSERLHLDEAVSHSDAGRAFYELYEIEVADRHKQRTGFVLVEPHAFLGFFLAAIGGAVCWVGIIALVLWMVR